MSTGTSAVAVATAPDKDRQSEAVTQAVQVGGAIASQFVPPPIGAVIAEGVNVEPEIYHLISALLHMFHKQKAAKG
jgi:hypothetical protein